GNHSQTRIRDDDVEFTGKYFKRAQSESSALFLWPRKATEGAQRVTTLSFEQKQTKRTKGLSSSDLFVPFVCFCSLLCVNCSAPGCPSLQFIQGLFDLVKIGEFFGGWCLLAVLDYTLFIDDKGSTGGGIAYSGQHRKNHVVLFNHFLV